MKNLRKLVPTICMLMISAMMLGTSTFAWFSMNKTVTASGMKIIAQTASTLLIDTASATDTNGKLSNGLDTQNINMTTADALAPASSIDGNKWFTATAAQATSKDAKTGSYYEIGSESVNKYRLKSTFYLQFYDATKTLDSDTNQKLYVDSITITHNAPEGTNDDLSNSLRVMIVVDDEIMVCAPMTSTTPTNKAVASVSSDGVATLNDVTYTNISIGSSKATLGENTLVANMGYNTVYTANIYIFFDGEDNNCKTDNIPATLNDYSVTVSFSVEDLNI